MTMSYPDSFSERYDTYHNIELIQSSSAQEFTKMAWDWSNGEEKENASKGAGSLIDDAGSLIDVSAKMQGLLDDARNKFEDKYKDVKLRYD